MDRVQSYALPAEDFPRNSPERARLLEVFPKAQGTMVAFRYPTGQVGKCYWNAAKGAKEIGGKVVHGWMLTWVPGLFIEAMHHAVVQTADGLLHDCTKPPYATMKPDADTTFIIDEEIEIDLNWPPMIECRFVVLSEDPNVRLAIKHYRRHRAAMLESVAIYRAKGCTWDPIKEWTPNPPIDGRVVHRIQEELRAIHHYRALLRQRHFPEFQP